MRDSEKEQTATKPSLAEIKNVDFNNNSIYNIYYVLGILPTAIC